MSKRVKLGDVVAQIKEKVDKDNTNLEYYIGGEHIDNYRRVINKKGILQGSTIGSAFKMKFMPGDVLLMSRNPHLCKASMVDFEGICSDVSYVCRTLDENVFSQRLLPFLLQTNAFWNHAEKNKRGGMPFFLNWKDFASFEFNLPSPEDQEKLANLLWASEETKSAYEEQFAATKLLVKAIFNEMFLDKNFPKIKLGDACEKITDGTHKTPNYQDEGVVFISAKNIVNGKLDFSDVKYITEEEYRTIQDRCQVEVGDVLIAKSGTLGTSAIVETEIPFGVFESLGVLKYKRDILNPFFLHAQLQMDEFRQGIINSSKGVSIKHLPINLISETEILLPPIELQEDFQVIYKQIDKTLCEIKQSIEKIETVIKSLSEQTFM